MKVGVVVGIVGLVLSAVGGIWFLVASFKVSIWWGLACLFLAPAQLVFLFKHWKEARKPFAVGILAMGIILVAVYLMVEDPLQFLQHLQQSASSSDRLGRG
jgi:drug/metabolite transporter (DMT)-like permease